MSEIFTWFDKQLLIKNLNLRNNLTRFEAPGSYDDAAYSAVKYADLSEKAQKYFADVIGQTNRLPGENDVIGITWSKEWKWGCSFYVFDKIPDISSEWYAGADIEDDDVLKDIFFGHIPRVEKLPLSDRIFNAYERFMTEMDMQHVWNSNCFAQTYFAGLQREVKEILNECIKHNPFCEEEHSSPYSLNASLELYRISKVMEPDYNELTEEIAKSKDIAFLSRQYTVGIIEKQFLVAMRESFDILNKVYKKEMGIGLAEKLIKKQGQHATFTNIASELEEEMER